MIGILQQYQHWASKKKEKGTVEICLNNNVDLGNTHL